MSKDSKNRKVIPDRGGSVSQQPDGSGKHTVYSRTWSPAEYPEVFEPYKPLDKTFYY